MVPIIDIVRQLPPRSGSVAAYADPTKKSRIPSAGCGDLFVTGIVLALPIKTTASDVCACAGSSTASTTGLLHLPEVTAPAASPLPARILRTALRRCSDVSALGMPLLSNFLPHILASSIVDCRHSGSYSAPVAPPEQTIVEHTSCFCNPINLLTWRS